MLASRTRCSLCTGTTISTRGRSAGSAGGGCVSRSGCMAPMVGSAPWGRLGRAWELAGSSAGGVGGQGEDHPEPGPAAGDAVDSDGAAVGGGQGGHDRQPQPGAAGGPGAGRVGPVEALEHPLALLGGKAVAVVDDLDGRP